MSVSLERLARNQTLFREVNERLLEMSNGGNREPVSFLCECSREECAETIPLSLAEYDEVRSHPTRFVIVAGHETLEVENVVETTERYAIVQKKNGVKFAVASDPRSGGAAE